MKNMKKISKKGPLTSAERTARYRAKKRAEGYIEVIRWVKKSDLNKEAGNCK